MIIKYIIVNYISITLIITLIIALILTSQFVFFGYRCMLIVRRQLLRKWRILFGEAIWILFFISYSTKMTVFEFNFIYNHVSIHVLI